MSKIWCLLSKKNPVAENTDILFKAIIWLADGGLGSDSGGNEDLCPNNAQQFVTNKSTDCKDFLHPRKIFILQKTFSASAPSCLLGKFHI